MFYVRFWRYVGLWVRDVVVLWCCMVLDDGWEVCCDERRRVKLLYEKEVEVREGF